VRASLSPPPSPEVAPERLERHLAAPHGEAAAGVCGVQDQERAGASPPLGVGGHLGSREVEPRTCAWSWALGACPHACARGDQFKEVGNADKCRRTLAWVGQRVPCSCGLPTLLPIDFAVAV